MKAPATDAERVVFVLMWPRHVTVGGDRHRKIGSGHRFSDPVGYSGDTSF
jgi:hypothetical protein